MTYRPVPAALSVALAIACLSSTLAAQSPEAAAKKGPPRATLQRDRQQRLRLMIEYPWAAFSQGSVEVRLATGESDAVGELRPMFFVHNHFHGETARAIYSCQDHVDDPGHKRSVKLEGFDVEVIARRTDLDRSAACVVRRFPSKASVPGVAAAFLQLDRWSLDKNWLQIELPATDFLPPGRMWVWFLRDDTVLWEEQLAWPGMVPPKDDKGPAQPAAGAAAPGG